MQSRSEWEDGEMTLGKVREEAKWKNKNEFETSVSRAVNPHAEPSLNGSETCPQQRSPA